MVDGHVLRLETSVRELATAVAELARDRDVAERMARIVGRHPDDSSDDEDDPDDPLPPPRPPR